MDSNLIYLYLKIHNKTGLKYLGKTVKDPFIYKGSGKYWCRHLAKHGDDVTTEILFQSTSKNKIKEKGLYYSNLWSIVENKDFANLKEESGDGGTYLDFDYSKASKDLWSTDEYRNKQLTEGQPKRVKKLIGRKASKEHCQKISNALKNKPKSESHKRNLSESNKKPNAVKRSMKNLENANRKEKCIHCGMVATIGNIRRWHNDKCKHQP